MSLAINIISAIGNNSSIAPLIVRDCGIEIPAKVAMTYYQNKSDKDIAYLGARERMADEYLVSAAWLGGVPFIGKICNKITKKLGFNPCISSKLFKEDGIQGLKYNINKFKDSAPNAVAELEKIAKNQKKYRNLLAGKFLAQTIIPTALMGWIIPKVIFAWTAYSKTKRKNCTTPVIQDFSPAETPAEKFSTLKSPAFKGLKDINIGSLADLTNRQKLIITDSGYTAGRIATARKRNEAYDIGFKMAGMMFLNYCFPNWLEKVLDQTSAQLLNTNLDLDVKLLTDEKFLSLVEKNGIELPASDNPKTLIEFIDNNPSSEFTKYANQYGKIKMLNDKVRDPRAYIDCELLGKFRNSIDNFIKMSQNAQGNEITNNVQKFAKKAKFVKIVNILTNVIITSGLLAFGLPKLQFLFREKITGSKLEPGIIE